jgi:hypothetical protein
LYFVVAYILTISRFYVKIAHRQRAASFPKSLQRTARLQSIDEDLLASAASFDGFAFSDTTDLLKRFHAH